MKWRNERGDTDTSGMFWVGAILFLAVLAFVLAMGGGIAGALAGIGV